MTKHSILTTEIYPKLYPMADRVFPEFAFKQRGTAWVASAKLDIDGSPTSAPGKVYLYQDMPGRLYSHKQGQSCTVWDYLGDREGLKGRDLLKYMADLASVTLQPQDSRAGRPPPKGIPPKLLADALPWMVEQLWVAKDAAKVRAYLLETRGYSEADCRKMNLGFISDRTAFAAYLNHAGHTDKQIGFFLRLDKDKADVPFTSTHRLIIPVYGVERQLEGLCFRATTDGAQPKYLNTYGLNKGRALFAYKPGETAVVIVEGILDAHIAQARGVSNVVPLNGASLSLGQLEMLEKCGIQSITLCLDNDQAGAAARKKIFKTLLENPLSLRVYVASLPMSIKDPDELMRQQDVAAFQQVLETAKGFGQYLGVTLANQYSGESAPSPRKRDALVQRCFAIDSRFSYHPDRLDFRNALSAVLQRFGLSLADYEQTLIGMAKAQDNTLG